MKLCHWQTKRNKHNHLSLSHLTGTPPRTSEKVKEEMPGNFNLTTSTYERKRGETSRRGSTTISEKKEEERGRSYFASDLLDGNFAE